MLIAFGRLRFALVLLGAVAWMQLGCSIWWAGNLPGPKDDERIALGMNRAEVERAVQAGPVSSYADRDGTVAHYEYIDGPRQTSRARIAIYFAGDLATAALAEIIFWPIELYAENQAKRLAIAHFDPDNYLARWHLSKPSGQVIRNLEPPVPLHPPKPPAGPASEQTAPSTGGASDGPAEPSAERIGR